MNGYTQLNLDKPRGFKWGKYAFEKYMRMLKFESKVNIDEKLNSEHSSIILYCGLSMNCFVKQTEPDFTFEDCVEWDEGMSAEDQVKINEAVEECQWFKNFNEQIKKKGEEVEKLLQKSGGSKKSKK